MSEISRRRALGLMAAAAVGVPLAGCGTGRPGWAQGFSTGRGRAADSGSLSLRNIVVVSAAAGTGTLLTTIFNGSSVDDSLLKLAVVDGDATLLPAAIPLPAGGDAVIGMDTSLAEKPSTVILRGAPVKAGYFVQLTFTFERAGPVDVGALVVAHEDEYAAVPLPDATEMRSPTTAR